MGDAEWERVDQAVKRLIEAVHRTAKRDVLEAVEGRLERAMGRAFRAQGRAFGRAWRSSSVAKEAFPMSEALPSGDWLEPLFSKSELETLKLFREPLEAAVEEALTRGALHLVGQAAVDYTFKLANPRAVAYVKAHGADLVSRVHETTRGDIRHIVQYATEHGWSYNRTALAIQERFKGYSDGESWWNFDAPRPQGHIDSRAHLIAVTEAGEAYEEGNYLVAQDLKEKGLEMEKRWSTMGDDRVSAGCLENEAEGWIAADQTHRSGHLHPLRFPGCRCDEMYRVKE